MNVSNLSMKDGRIFFCVRGKGCGERFFNRNTCVVLDEHIENGTFLKCAEGWELAQAPKASKASKAQKPESAKESAKAQKPASPESVPAETAEKPKAEKAPTSPEKASKAQKPASVPAKAEKPAETAENADLGAQLARIISGMKGANIDEDKVREIVRQELKAQKADKVIEVKVLGKESTAQVETPHPLLEKVLALVMNDRALGRYPWLFGPAGSGKSTLASQVAKALDIPFYSVSAISQKYELEGYTDAAGELVKTSFYHAMDKGGVFLFDEASNTSPEVNVAFNSVAANLLYNFPKEGMKKANEKFHIIAADNTCGRGANNTYNARYQLDASTLDRYIFVNVPYTDTQDLLMAENDAELVAFFKEMRKAIEEARLTYTASPRAMKAIKGMQKLSGVFSELEAFYLGLCSGWAHQDIRTLNARISGTNKYFRLFNEIANS